MTGISPASGTYTVADLTAALSRSLRRPTGRTLSLINKALSYLIPFESPRARTVSQAERQDLLNLLTAHRLVLSPYMDIDRAESNLLRPIHEREVLGADSTNRRTGRCFTAELLS